MKLLAETFWSGETKLSAKTYLCPKINFQFLEFRNFLLFYSWHKIGKWSPREFLYVTDLRALQSGIRFQLEVTIPISQCPNPPPHCNCQKIQIISKHCNALPSYNLFQFENLAVRIISSFRFRCKRTQLIMTSQFGSLKVSGIPSRDSSLQTSEDLTLHRRQVSASKGLRFWVSKIPRTWVYNFLRTWVWKCQALSPLVSSCQWEARG